MSLKENYRKISGSEIEVLKMNGCSCDDWTRISVKDGFKPETCVNVIFSGDISLGVFTEPFIDKSGISFPSGVSNARLHNCIVGSDVVIKNIGGYIANYIIEDKVIIINCDRLYTDGLSSFGNGTSVAVLSETGARSVKIWDRLSAHEAYIVALYRHRNKAISNIEKMADNYSASIASERGTIGFNSRIFDCGKIRNVKVGSYGHIEGAVLLNEGSINSCEADPVLIGPGVIINHFIVCSGSTVSESAVIDTCFIGQGCVLSKQYSAENSLFFANCSGFHGEACSIFAGPYTVTHHKSTLLIAGIFSFMNAGSGSNQSNHMYKLGPVHQGIMERGSKTTSNSYLVWPSHIGPFTLVKGSHYKNLDTTSFPFSYLIESDNESVLVPGINLRSVGTMRDAQKWPLRERRKDPMKTDQVNFNILSPYTVRKMMAGREILKRLKKEQSSGTFSYIFENMLIKGSSLERGIDLYQTGIIKYIGNSLIKRLENIEFGTNEILRNRLTPEVKQGIGEWVDIAGLIAPQSEVEQLLDKIESGKISLAEGINKAFFEMHNSYSLWEWTWVCEKIEEETGILIRNITAADIIKLIESWKKSVTDLDTLLYEDAKKEFTTSSMTGFGIDGDDEVKKLDFEQVREDFESHSVVVSILQHIEQKTVLGDELISRLRRIR